ncbi:hypothetical protein P9112_004688 [Eukaryota sp. TZLM1-RC]
MSEHFHTIGRTVHIVNLDPAAEYLPYTPSFDIRNLISLEDAMEEMDFGPNGGLVFCMEYLLQNMDWLEEELGSYEDDYLLLDCPGQVELYTNVPMMRHLTKTFVNWGYNMVGIYCLDSNIVLDPCRFISGFLTCVSTMYQFSLPHVNVLTKTDLIADKSKLEELGPSNPDLLDDLDRISTGKYRQLNRCIVDVLQENDVVSLLPVNYNDEDSLSNLLLHIDLVSQYFDDAEVKESFID